MTYLGNDGNEISFRNNKKYILKRKYSKNGEPGPIIRDYLIVFRDGNIFMGYDLNANGNKDISTINLQEQNITTNCIEVSLKQNKNSPLPTCIRCTNSNDFILSPFDSVENEIMVCRPRNVKINLCNKYYPSSNECLECEENYFLYPGERFQKCVSSIPGCKKIKIGSNKLFCEECFENLILKNNSCKDILISSPNCKTSENGNCLACEPGHFLFKNTCLTNLIYSFFFCPMDENKNCNCGSSALEVNRIDECVSIKEDNCLIYDENDDCFNCRNGFYLNSNLTCLSGEIPFCVKYEQTLNTNQICSKCEVGYVLENNVCRKSLNLYTDNCLDQLGEECKQCSNETYKISFELRVDTLTVCDRNVFFESNPKVKNCLFFNQFTSQCELCSEGLWVDENGNCETCDFTTHGIDNFNQKCVKKDSLQPGCELYDENFCVKCSNSKNPIILDNELFTLATREYTDRSKNQYIEEPSFVINECDVELSAECNTNHCQNASRFIDGSTCCFKCNSGRTGQWSQKDQEFYTLNCDTKIEFCNINSKLKGISMSYSKYLSCNECLGDRIVQLNLTEGESQIQCISQPENRPELNNCLIMVENDCRVCKEKFKKVQIGDNIQCQEIANCASSQTVEKCEVCEEGFSLSQDFEQCLVEPVRFCKEVNDQLECIKCKDGMILNKNKCFSINMPDCLKFDGENCIECNLRSLNNSGIQTSVFANILIKMIFRSESINTQANKTLCLLPNGTNPSLKNCKHYDTPTFCKKCESGYLPQKTSLLNDDLQSCVRDPQITENCLLLDPSGNCINCEDGFYLEGDRCFAGNINGCKSYKNQLNCKECLSSFTLLSQDSRDLCFFSHKIQNCSETGFFQSQINKLNLTCLKCNYLFRKKEITISNQLCFPLRAIPNCKTLNPINSKCQECDDLFYLNQDQVCKKRNNLQFTNCKRFSIMNDFCGECEDGYQLNSSGNCSPISFEIINNCQIQFKGKLECLVCADGYFVSESKTCLPVNPIFNCINYQTQNQCAFCEEGFRVVDGICEEIFNQPIIDTGIKAESLRNSEIPEFIVEATTSDPTSTVETTVTVLDSPEDLVNSGLIELEDNLLPTDSIVISSDPNNVNSSQTLRMLQGNFDILEGGKNLFMDQFNSKDSSKSGNSILDGGKNLILNQLKPDNSSKSGNSLLNSGKQLLFDKIKPEEPPRPNNSIANVQENLFESTSDKMTDAILGKDSNSMIKDLVSNQIKNKISDKVGDIAPDSIKNLTTDQLKAQIENKKDDVLKNLKDKTPNQLNLLKDKLKDLNPDDPQILKEVIKEENTQQNLVIPVEKPVPEPIKPVVIQSVDQINSIIASDGKIVQSVFVVPSFQNENSSSKSKEPMICGLCKPMYQYSTISNKCTKIIEDGCMIINPKYSNFNSKQFLKSNFSL